MTVADAVTSKVHYYFISSFLLIKIVYLLKNFQGIKRKIIHVADETVVLHE